MIDKKELLKIEEKIKSEINTTQKLVEEYKDLTQPVAPGCEIGRVSRMDAINNKSVTEAALREAEKKLDGLIYIQSQLHSDDFGICARCHSPIPLGRIMLMPHSRFCVRCASF